MIKRYVVAPVALLSTACSLRPWTPSVSVAFWSQPVPTALPVSTPSSSAAIDRWLLPPSNPWSRWDKFTLLASLGSAEGYSTELPDVMQLEVVRNAREAARRVACAGLPSNTMWVVDLRGAASVAFGATLSQESVTPVSPVLTFNNWPAEYELIPAEETLAALLAMRPRLPPDDASVSTPVVLLDAWRLAYRNDTTADDVTDNRYILNPVDLPDVGTLQAHGITQVVYLVQDLNETDIEEDDLNAVMLEYQAAGITLFMLDLRYLLEMPVPETCERPLNIDWRVHFRHCHHHVRRRHTLLDDVLFFGRAHGGFGGVHGGPSPFRSGVIFHMGRRPPEPDVNGGSSGGHGSGWGGWGGWSGGGGG